MDIAKLILIILLSSFLSLFGVKSVYSATLPASPSDGSSLVNPDETDFSEDIFNNDYSTDVTDTATTANTTTATSTLVDNNKVNTTTTTTKDTTTLTDTPSGSNTGVVIILAMILSSLLLILVKSINHKKRNVQ